MSHTVAPAESSIKQPRRRSAFEALTWAERQDVHLALSAFRRDMMAALDERHTVCICDACLDLFGFDGLARWVA